MRDDIYDGSDKNKINTTPEEELILNNSWLLGKAKVYAKA